MDKRTKEAPHTPVLPVDVVLDTDTFNEIDDQFALAYLILHGEQLRLKAVTAAPFDNENSTGPGDGMERSYLEILKILELMDRSELAPLVFRGSARWLPDEHTPVDSPAAREIVRLAQAYSSARPLYVIAIGAMTNVASALLLAPEIAERITVVWLGGHSLKWPMPGSEFNMAGDLAASRAVMNSDVPLVLLPCMGVVSSFYVTKPELEFWLVGKNRLCDYLAQNTIAAAESYAGGKPWNRVIWDVTAVAWLLGGFCDDREEVRPIPTYEKQYEFDTTKSPIRYVYHIRRDALVEDLIRVLTHAF
jgi:inosine-uridine nucleoside N-ribohydrolase